MQGIRTGHVVSATVGYVFWHWPGSGIRQKTYLRKLLAFQSSLEANRPDGLIEALSFRVHALPWANHRGWSCEDWYLVTDFGALGALNDAAVDDANRRSHDEVAKEASGCAGGLYKLRQENLRLREARFATWIRKPPGTTYRSFLDRLSRLVGERRTDLWQRQMVLGPAPEFCLHSETRINLPRDFGSTAVRVRLVGGKGDKQ